MSRGHQRWRCKACGFVGTENGAPPYRKYGYRFIAGAHELYFDGLSLKRTARNLGKFLGLRPSKSSVWRWITTYSEAVSQFLRNFSVVGGETWCADEMAIKCAWEQEPDKWFWNVMDKESRFILSRLVTKWGREDEHAVALFREAKRVAEETPNLIVTDRLAAYREGIRKNFYSNREGRLHLNRIHLTAAKANNNTMERKWGSDRGRTKVMRAFKRVESATAILGGATVHYNFLREHEALGGETPAMEAGIALPFEDGWADLIRWATYWKSHRGSA